MKLEVFTMARKKKSVVVALETIWEIPDEAWERLEPILLEHYPPAGTGRPRADWRKVVNGIIFRMRTGCQWNRLPKIFGDDSTVHRWFQRWSEDNIFKELWADLLLECDELGGIDWKWQSADGCLGKARFPGEKRAATPRTGESPARRKVSSSKPMAVRSAS